MKSKAPMLFGILLALSSTSFVIASSIITSLKLNQPKEQNTFGKYDCLSEENNEKSKGEKYLNNKENGDEVTVEYILFGKDGKGKYGRGTRGKYISSKTLEENSCSSSGISYIKGKNGTSPQKKMGFREKVKNINTSDKKTYYQTGDGGVNNFLGKLWNEEVIKRKENGGRSCGIYNKNDDNSLGVNGFCQQ